MPLDPQVRSLVEAAARELDQSSGGNLLARARAAAELTRGVRGEHVAGVEHHDADGVTLRLYRPQAREESMSILYFHPGAWISGSIEASDFVCRALANATHFDVLSVDYRLAPEAEFPAPVEDAWTALRWLRDRAGDAPPAGLRIAAVGESAGANIAAALAVLARERGPQPPDAQVLICPVTDMRFWRESARMFGHDYLLETDGLRWSRDKYLPDAAPIDHPLASPLNAVEPGGLPPTLVLTAEYDPLRDQGEEYARRLAESGVDAEYRRYAGMIHGFFSTPGLDAAADALSDVAAWLRTHS